MWYNHICACIIAAILTVFKYSGRQVLRNRNARCSSILWYKEFLSALRCRSCWPAFSTRAPYHWKTSLPLNISLPQRLTRTTRKIPLKSLLGLVASLPPRFAARVTIENLQVIVCPKVTAYPYFQLQGPHTPSCSKKKPSSRIDFIHGIFV